MLNMFCERKKNSIFNLKQVPTVSRNINGQVFDDKIVIGVPIVIMGYMPEQTRLPLHSTK